MVKGPHLVSPNSSAFAHRKNCTKTEIVKTGIMIGIAYSFLPESMLSQTQPHFST